MAPCWSCRQELAPPVRLRFGRVVALNAGTRVTRHHLMRDYAYGDIVAQVVPHPSGPDLWGLRNGRPDLAGDRPRRHRAGGGSGPQPRARSGDPHRFRAGSRGPCGLTSCLTRSLGGRLGEGPAER